MNLQISGHHLEVSPAIRDYVSQKLQKVTRHFDHVIDIHVVLSVEKLNQKAEVTLHVPGVNLAGCFYKRQPTIPLKLA